MDSPDLSKLSHEELLEYYDLLEEIERRSREEALTYKPNAGQIEVHRSEKELRVVTSGNGAGKTALAANEAIWRAKGFNLVLGHYTKVPARVIVLLDHPDKVGKTWLPEIIKWTNLRPDQLKQRGKPYISEIVFDNGSEIMFMFHEQSPLVFESIEFDMLIVDEPCPRPIWIALRRGGRKKGRKSNYLMVGTPIAGSWLRTEIIEPAKKGELPEVEVFKFGTVVNAGNLEDGYVEKFGKYLSEKERRIRLEGEFYDLEGLALGHLFNPSVHVIDPFQWSNEWPVVVAIDPHPTKAHYAILMGCDDEGFLYYIDEIKLKAAPRDFARQLKKWYQGYRVVDITCDSLGNAEGTGGEGFKSFIQILVEEGVRARATTYDDKSDEDFIIRIQDALYIPDEPNGFGHRTPKLRFFKGQSYGIVHDIENVSWVKHRDHDLYKPKLDISNKDFLACVKYALATNIKPGKSKASIYRPTAPPESYVGRPMNPIKLQFSRLRRKGRPYRKASK